CHRNRRARLGLRLRSKRGQRHHPDQCRRGKSFHAKFHDSRIHQGGELSIGYWIPPLVSLTIRTRNGAKDSYEQTFLFFVCHAPVTRTTNSAANEATTATVGKGFDGG